MLDSLRVSAICICLLLAAGMTFSTQAAWTGIGAFVGQSESDWLVGGESRVADVNMYGFRIEEKSRTELRVGASAGQISVRLQLPDNSSLADKYYAQFISFYLRLPLKITDSISFHSRLNYQFNSGDSSRDDDEEAEIDWTQLDLNLGLSFTVSNLSLRPFVNFRNIDGDINTDAGTRVFEEESSYSGGLIFDYAVEPTAYVRLTATAGERDSLMLSFVREL